MQTPAPSITIGIYIKESCSLLAAAGAGLFCKNSKLSTKFSHVTGPHIIMGLYIKIPCGDVLNKLFKLFNIQCKGLHYISLCKTFTVKKKKIKNKKIKKA